MKAFKTKHRKNKCEIKASFIIEKPNKYEKTFANITCKYLKQNVERRKKCEIKALFIIENCNKYEKNIRVHNL